MGFGYLLVGYLISFVLRMLAANLGMGGIVFVIGCAMMLAGLWNLHHYHEAFFYSKWAAVALIVLGCYDVLKDLDELFLWNLGFLNGKPELVFSWILFFLILFFNLAMLYGIRMISRDLGILHMETSAIRNSFFVALHAILYMLGNLPIVALSPIQSYLIVPIVFTNLIWLFCNLFLLLACNKNICRSGDEDQPTKPSRIGFLNRMNEIYEENRQKAIQKTTREAEDALRRRKEKREQKKINHNKKRKGGSK